MSAVDTIRSFKLSDSFLEEFKDRQPEWGYNGLGYIVYKRTYARTLPDGSLEEFWQTCKRVVEGVYDAQKKHCKSLRLPWDDRKAQRSAQEMFRRMWAFKWLPPGRGLWMMGAPAVERLGSAALNNCLAGNTLVPTKELGMVKLADIVGQEVSVQTSKGWAKGVCKSFGTQTLNKISFKPCISSKSRTETRFTVEATESHGWMLASGEKTYSLAVGDEVASLKSPSLPVDKEGSIHGWVFADGTISWEGKQYTRYQLRLCGDKARVKDFFSEISYPASTEGDPVVRVNHVGPSLKSLPPEDATLAYHAAFLQAWLDFDGYTKSTGNAVGYCLDTTQSSAVEYVKTHAPLIGLVVTGVSVETSPTNYGSRNAGLYHIKLQNIEDVKFRVTDIEFSVRDEEVFCFEVPDYNEFALAGGLYSLNCGFVSTKGIREDFADPFCWLMDMLMLGVGVGFDTKGAGLVKIQDPIQIPDTFVVEDSREGWVALLRVVLNAHVGKGGIPSAIDYSKVRPEGEPIRGFGGVASGPKPLMELVDSVKDVLRPIVGQDITVSAIVDICNLIGRCVVAGNVRRSAEIAFGRYDDDEFLNLKNPDINQEALYHHRWASNNSVFAEIGMDYSRVAELTAKNGEPGYQWLKNAREFSRMGRPEDYSDMRVMGANPCFSGDTLVAVADGRHAVSFKQLAEEGRDVPVYSLTKDGKVEIQWGRNPRMTRASAKLVRIHMDDGSTLDVTPDHSMIMRDGSIKAAKDLVAGDSLPKHLKRLAKTVAGGPDYLQVVVDINDPRTSGGTVFEHKLIALFHQAEQWDALYDENQNRVGRVAVW
ncbi:hypothetical protein HC928_00040 [bacterium]|nr:hypothetical protein [bacterium]